MKVYVVIGEYEEYIVSDNNINKNVSVEGVFSTTEFAIDAIKKITAEYYPDYEPLYEREGEVAFDMGENCIDRLYIVEKEMYR